MSDLHSIEEVKQYFKNDHFAITNGADILEAADGYAKCSMKLDEHHYNARGAVMGGATYTLADFTFAVASKGAFVSQTCQITYLGVAKGKQLLAKAQKVREGRTTCYYLVEIKDELDNEVAHMTVNGYRICS